MDTHISILAYCMSDDRLIDIDIIYPDIISEEDTTVCSEIYTC